MTTESETPESAINVDLENSTDLILITDPFGMYLNVSASVTMFLGYDRKEMEGRIATDFIHPLDLAGTRDEMRSARHQQRPRHFYCRYIDKSGRPVELVWTGVWVEDKAQHVFIGRLPRRGERLPLIHRLDPMDGFQVAKGMFALSLVVGSVFGLGPRATMEIRQVIAALGGTPNALTLLMITYALSCFTCLFWKNRVLEFTISVISTVMWIWMGVITLLSPTYVAAAGIYEVMLGVGSIFVLYLRGRLL
jgi:PAS domain S-box-containing protein